LRVGRRLGQSEVQNLCLSARCHEDIGWLYVAVHKATGVRCGQSICNLPGDSQGVVDRQKGDSPRAHPLSLSSKLASPESHVIPAKAGIH
jgi:hypothetical protein